MFESRTPIPSKLHFMTTNDLWFLWITNWEKLTERYCWLPRLALSFALKWTWSDNCRSLGRWDHRGTSLYLSLVVYLSHICSYYHMCVVKMVSGLSQVSNFNLILVQWIREARLEFSMLQTMSLGKNKLTTKVMRKACIIRHEVAEWVRKLSNMTLCQSCCDSHFTDLIMTFKIIKLYFSCLSAIKPPYYSDVIIEMKSHNFKIDICLPLKWS